MLARGPDEALPHREGKHVPSMAPGKGPRDLSADLARQRAGNDARPTAPPGGYPQTVGGNPDAPAVRQASDDGRTAAGAPGAYSAATKWAGGGAVTGGY